MEDRIGYRFSELEQKVVEHDEDRWQDVEGLLRYAYKLARHLWEKSQKDEYRGAVDPSEAKRYCLICGALDANHAPGGSRYGSCDGAYANEPRGVVQS